MTPYCRGHSCRAKIAWHRTEHGKWLALNYDPIDRAEALERGYRGVFFLDDYGRALAAVPVDVAHLGEDLFLAHWATCPDRERFRR